ncbi:MAG TPA: pyrrolo-quinoline quinone [Verrucomicrobiae bacterium]|jgi:hypothetical protein
MEKTKSNATHNQIRQFCDRFFPLYGAIRFCACKFGSSLAPAGGAGLLRILFAAMIFPLNSHAEDVLTYHNDNARTGQNLNETQLTLDNVNTNTFGFLFFCPVDGQIFAQPLYLANVAITNHGTHNVVFVATSHDSVYAFDADANAFANNYSSIYAPPLWHVSFIDTNAGVTTLSPDDVGFSIPSEIGITSTPVIDPATGTLYLETSTKEVSGATTNYIQRLHALDVGSGSEKFGGPVVIQAMVPGTGMGTDGAGNVPFDGLREFNRASLLLDHGIVYVTFGSHSDIGNYHGWVLGYNAKTLKPQGVFNDTPNGLRGGIWQSGGGPAADTNGNLYFTTGNGTFDGATNNDYGDSFVKLTLDDTNLALSDYFCPFNQFYLENTDLDLGSAGLVVLPDEVGSALHPHLMIGGSKNQELYLIDRDNMGGFDFISNANIVQDLTNNIDPCFSTPAYFNKTLYLILRGAPLQAFSFTNGLLSTNPTAESSFTFYPPGCTVCVSAHGTNNGIVWALNHNYPSGLYAFNATNVARELYDSQQNPDRDPSGFPSTYSTPIVANGKVYFGTVSALFAYGLIVPFGQVAAAPAPGNQIALTWTSYFNYSVEFTTNLVPPIVWTPVKQSPVVKGTQMTVTVPRENNAAFYRLKAAQ